jgi:DNA-binding XRE family transcriptional regulator
VGDGDLTLREAGRIGGERTLARHGRAHFVAAGRKGGAALSAEAHAEAGRKGGRARHGETHALLGLKAARERAGLSRLALSKAAGLNRDTVRLLELGNRASAGTISKLGAALGVDPAVLKAADGAA